MRKGFKIRNCGFAPLHDRRFVRWGCIVHDIRVNADQLPLFDPEFQRHPSQPHPIHHLAETVQ